MKKFNSIYKNVGSISFIQLIIINIYFNGIIAQNIAVVPFKSFLPKEDDYIKESKALISSWIYRKIYLDIETLSGQKISMLLNNEEPKIHTNNITAYLKSDDIYNSKYVRNISHICSFNYHNSNSYHLISKFNYSFYSISNVCYASEKMIFYKDIDLKEKSAIDLNFIHSSNSSNNCFLAGLVLTNLMDDKKINLFYQLKQIINSKNYDWGLYFTSPNEGKFIFGDIKNNENIKFYNTNDKNNFISIQVNTLYRLRIYWKIKIDKIIIGNDYIKETNTFFEIDIHIRYISVPKLIFDDTKHLYFLDKGKDNLICFEEISNFFFHTIYCDKNEFLKLSGGYNNLPTLNLNFISTNERYNISFNANDLFLEIGDKIYFFIGYNSRMTLDDKFVIGSLLLEKYITIFNNEEKTLTILKKNEENDKNNGNKDIVNKNSDNVNNKIVIISLLVFILSAVIFIIIGKLFGKKLFAAKKKKANELIDEDYDYTPERINDENKVF